LHHSGWYARAGSTCRDEHDGEQRDASASRDHRGSTAWRAHAIQIKMGLFTSLANEHPASMRRLRGGAPGPPAPALGQCGTVARRALACASDGGATGSGTGAPWRPGVTPVTVAVTVWGHNLDGDDTGPDGAVSAGLRVRVGAQTLPSTVGLAARDDPGPSVRPPDRKLRWLRLESQCLILGPKQGP
jgi:hypothetical protein